VIDVVHGKTMKDWIEAYPLIKPLVSGVPVTWFNPGIASASEALHDVPLAAAEVHDASARLARFAPFLAEAFPEVASTRGIIESDLVPVDGFMNRLCTLYGIDKTVSMHLKMDSHLPISGSVKARGGIYEVLHHAEYLASTHGMLADGDDYRLLLKPGIRKLFRQHRIVVGSTGNLGMSIGIAGARLGFDTTVHMSDDARQWKKDKLRAHGVNVVEHRGDYGEAVEQGRRQAQLDPACHFIDDENSTTLFLGYAVAGERLKRQLEQKAIQVDARHPLFVYLPCGVGGGPGGISFGLKLAFGDHVHCIFAEPTQSPCMLMGVYTGLHERIAVQDFGISNITAADGLAVGRPSGFVGRAMHRLIDGYYTVPDSELFAALHLMHETQGIQLEPSALAGAPGFSRVLHEREGYRERIGVDAQAWQQATHIVWATGGGMLPEEEYRNYLAIGRNALLRPL